MIFPVESVLATVGVDAQKEELLSMISAAEKLNEIPVGLLASIAKIESGVNAFAINLNGKAIFANGREEAASIVEQALGEGMTNIDIGVMQLNWRWHSREFKNVGEMVSPAENIEYAASLLKSLHDKYGDWHKAVRYYHSSREVHHKKYSRKVVMAWLNG